MKASLNPVTDQQDPALLAVPLAAEEADGWYCEEAGDDCGMAAACGRLVFVLDCASKQREISSARPSSVCTFLPAYSLLAKGVNLARSCGARVEKCRCERNKVL